MEWQANTLERAAATWVENPLDKNFNRSSSDVTSFINGVSTLDSRSYLKHLYGESKPVRQARSMVGLGSSFTSSRTLPASDLLRKRFMMVESHDAWVSFIRKAASEFPDVFNAEELALIETIPDA